MNKVLTDREITALTKTFPELSWIKPEDWQSVAGFADWRNWLDEAGGLEQLLEHRQYRRQIRHDCLQYWGEANVENINDPGDPTWATKL